MENDTIEQIATSIDRVAKSIRAPLQPGQDAAGGFVDSLTEAVMGMTAALMAISESINRVAEAIENGEQK